jgi:hypothetical protein
MTSTLEAKVHSWGQLLKTGLSQHDDVFVFQEDEDFEDSRNGFESSADSPLKQKNVSFCVIINA